MVATSARTLGRLGLLAGALLLCGAAGCTQKASDPATSPAPAGPPGTAEKPRRVEVKVSNLGYTPARILGRPGEALLLAFRYEQSAGECGREVVVPGAPKQRLEVGKVAEIPVKLPAAKGELRFTCGMDMLSGVLVAE